MTPEGFLRDLSKLQNIEQSIVAMDCFVCAIFIIMLIQNLHGCYAT